MKPAFWVSVIILIWVIVQFAYSRPDSICSDLLSWRQAETQNIARNFLLPDANLFYPRTNWGGDGPGYVEAEFQIYTYLIAQFMRFFGDVEWPGQVLNIFFMSLSAIVIYRILAQRFEEHAALFGMSVLLIGRSSIFISTSVQPDVLCFLFYTLGFSLFLSFVEGSGNKYLWFSALCTSIAALIKPTALQLGITEFFIVLFLYPQLFRKPMLWISWVVILIPVAVYYLHAHNLYVMYGNSFGVISGGDAKFPPFRTLLIPWMYVKILWVSSIWGLGFLGAIAGLYLLLMRQIKSIEWSLIIGNAAMLILSMRYTSNQGAGPHYHILTLLLSAWLTAHTFQHVTRTLTSRLHHKIFVFSSISLVIILYLFQLNQRHNFNVPGREPQWHVLNVGNALARFVKENDLVVVRSRFPSLLPKRWGGKAMNFEEPRIFYLAKTRGWVVPKDLYGAEKIKDYVSRGARYYAEPDRVREDDPELYAWLNDNAEIVYRGQDGIHERIYFFPSTKSD